MKSICISLRLLLGVLILSSMALSLESYAQGAGASAHRKLLSGHVPQSVSKHQAALIGRLSATQRLKFSIGLPLSNQAGLESFLKEVNDPASPGYHQYLSVQQFADRFAPSPAEYQAVVDFATASGLTVTDTPANRLSVSVEGPVAKIEQAFQTTMNLYQHPTEGRSFHAPATELTVPAGLPILHVSGLDDFTLPHPNMTKALLGQAQPKASYTGSGPSGDFIGNDFRAAYAPGVTLNGHGQSVALVEFGAYNLSDVQAYFAQAGTPLNVPIQNILLDGTTGVCGTNCGDDEEVLDIDLAIDMAPALSSVFVYEGNANNVVPLDVMTRIATDNLARQISCSWLWNYDPNETQVYMEFAAQGQSLFVASGDQGAYDFTYDGGDYVTFPAEDEYATAVGGTSLTTSSAGGPWQSEVAWTSFSGGGISPDNLSIPSYQQGIANSSNQASTVFRNVPDVSANAEQNMYLYANGAAETVGGTSAAAPIWAGFLALANQQAAVNNNPAIGFINTAIYSIGEGSSYGKDLHDITSGSNFDWASNDMNAGGFNAVTGYDLVTGWGTPAGQKLINALAGAGSSPDFNLWSTSAIVTLPLKNSVADTVTVTPLDGFDGNVSLSVSGLPNGVTATFSPSSTASTSTLTLTAGSSAKTGTFTVTVTGNSGSISHTVAFSLVVPAKAPDFSLSIPSDMTTTYTYGGDSELVEIFVNPLNGFTGDVSISVSGLPQGITPSYGNVYWEVTGASGGVKAATTPGTTTTPSQEYTILTLDADNTPTSGTFNVTVTGTSGNLKHTTTFTLIVRPPDFQLSLLPGSLSMTPGSSTTASLQIGQVDNNLDSNINLSISGMPKGVTASINPSSSAWGGTLTVTAGSTAAAGTYALTITGTGYGLTHTLPVTLVIEPVINTACITTTAGGPVLNTAIPAQTGTFTVTYDAMPSYFGGNSVVGLSNGPQTADSGFAVLTRFNSAGYIDAIDGSSYVPSTIQYNWGVGTVSNGYYPDHFRLAINLTNHTYSAYVSPGFNGGESEEQTIGTNMSFATGQNSVTQLNSWGTDSTTVTNQVCNFGY